MITTVVNVKNTGDWSANVWVPFQVELKKAADKIASVLAEKEALEAVALQLADERDGAMSEVDQST